MRARSAAYLLTVLLLAGCADHGATFLRPHGPVAEAQRDLLFSVTGWMMVVVLPAILLVPFVAWRYRRRRQGAYRPDWQFSWPLEIAVWGVPVVLVGILASLILTKARALDPYAPLAGAGLPLEVQVVGLDWKWLFLYPEEGIASLGEMALPVGRPVRFRLTSDTVMQSFAIPALGGQMYAMAGMVTELNLLATRPGVLRGQNTQFNGAGFQDQRFATRALPAAEFERWVAGARASGRVLDDAAFGQVARQGGMAELRRALGVAEGLPVLFAAPPGRFAAVVARYRPATVPSQGLAAPAATQGGAHRGH